MNDKRLIREEIERLMMKRPHIVILGAEASRAVCPNRDKNGKILPLMNDLIKILEFNDLKSLRIKSTNFEDIYSYLCQSDKHKDLRGKIEKLIYKYFESIEIPDQPTIYDHKCNERKCERIMRLFMEGIFGVPFESISFHKAYGLSKKEGGLLKWDGFYAKVIVKGVEYRIAFEYDGLQHDEFPNIYHKTRLEFQRQQERDIRKEGIASEDDKKTIIIRLKAKDGFDFTTTHLFEREIKAQFYKATGVRLVYRGYIYNIEAHSLLLEEGLMDKFLGGR